MNNFGKNIAVWAIIALLVVALFQIFQSPDSRNNDRELAFSEFLAEVKAGQVREVDIQGNSLKS